MESASRLEHRLRGDNLMACVESYPPAYVSPKHSHRHAYCSMVLRGGYREAGRDYSFGTVAYHPVGDCHANTMSEEPASEIYINFWEGWGEAANLDMPEERIDSDQPHLCTIMMRAWREALSQAPLGKEVLAEHAVNLLAAMSRRKDVDEAPRAKWFARSLEYLESEYRNHFRLRDLAKVAGVDPSHVVRTFQRRLGMTPAEYVRELRLGVAIRDLARGGKPIGEIGMEAGYADQSHFGRDVQANYGCTPATLRRTLV